MQIRKKKSWKIECSHLVIVNGSIVLTRFDMWCSSQQFVNVSKPSYGACSNFYNKKLSNYHWNRIFLKFFFVFVLNKLEITIWGGTRRQKEKVKSIFHEKVFPHILLSFYQQSKCFFCSSASMASYILSHILW